MQKEKICKGCDKSRRLFSGGLCITCYKKTKKYVIKKLKPIRKQTTKQQQTIRKYSKLRIEFLRNNPVCKIGLPDCTRQATEIHHSGKKYSEKLWLDTSLFVSCCHNCHKQIEESPDLAKKLGIYNYKV